jgi:putative oxidoreductase
MNRLTPYAAFFMRLAVGGVFLHHGLQKFHMGIPAVAGFLHTSVGLPFASLFAVIVMVVETLGAACVILGIFTRGWAACMAVEMVVAILAVQLPRGGNFELEGLLLAGALTLMALGDGQLSVAVRFKKPIV